MKSVLISIRPEWCEKIASGEKTLEVRKTRPKLETPFKVYIYCTSGSPYLVYADVFDGGSFNGQYALTHGRSRAEADKIWGIMNGTVIGEFVCDYIFPITVESNIHYELPGWPVETWLEWDSAPDEYDSQADIESATCLPLNKIDSYIGESCCCFCWHISDLKIYDKPKVLSEFTPPWELPYKGYAQFMKRPPQSWCYVEEVPDNGK